MKPSQRAAYFYGFSGGFCDRCFAFKRHRKKKKKKKTSSPVSNQRLSGLLIQFCLEILALSYHSSKMIGLFIS